MPWLFIYKLSSIRSRERIMLGTEEVNWGSARDTAH